MSEEKFMPMQGGLIFKALHDEECIVMACNTRIVKGVVKGIMRAAKETDSAVMFELAKSECNLEGGYTGFTPKSYSESIHKVAEDVEFDAWALHADHTTIKTGTPDEIEGTKKLLDAIIEAGYTSFSIDASFLYNEDGENVEEELSKNIDVTTELAKHIQENSKINDFGLEVEVGEIGKTNEQGKVLTTPEEAVAFVKALNNNGIYPHALAIANGSTHGNIFDENGKPADQVSIDISQTKKVAQALYDNKLGVRIAQHGITGTPLEFIKTLFPKKEITKGNVGTLWMNIVWDAFKKYEPELYKEIWDWTLSEFREKAEKKGMKSDDEIFGKFGKLAIKPFFEKIYIMSQETEKHIEDETYAEALKFFDAFNSSGSAQIARDYAKNNQ